MENQNVRYVTVNIRVIHIHEYRLLPSGISLASIVHMLVALTGLF